MPIDLQSSATATCKPLHHFWSVCVGAGRANEGLRASWQRQLRTAIDGCGFEYIRFHGLFHDDMFVFREQHGRPIYNFQYIDELFDALLEMGIRPFVEFGFCPSDLASVKNTVFWWKANGSPPKDFARWGELIQKTVKHWISRYGIEEVRQWYFEVWNEPNLHPFFKGTRSQYLELYRTTALVLKEIDSSLRVGGPATSNFVPDARFAGEIEDFSCHATVVQSKDLDALDWRPVWVEFFLRSCEREKLPVDFISCHPYPTDWALDALGETVKTTRSVNATRQDLAILHSIVDASAFPEAEIHLTEWSSSPSPRDFTHDCPQAATFIVKANLEAIGMVDSLSYWTFTDVFEENGAGDTPFHGGFGMLNFQGIPKPAFHAYRLLHTLGDVLLTQSPGGVVTRSSESGAIAALAYHYPSEMKLSVPASFDSYTVAEETLATGTPDSLRIHIRDLAPHTPFIVELIAPGSGDARRAWLAIGSPESPTREQRDFLMNAANASTTEIVKADSRGNLLFERALPPWAILSVRQI